MSYRFDVKEPIWTTNRNECKQ